MRPEDVPDNIVEAASEASWDTGETAFLEFLNDRHEDPDSETWERDRILWADARPEDQAEVRRDMRAALAAVIPNILAQELRSAANEIYGYAWQPGDAPKRTLTLEQQGVYMVGANDAHNIVDRPLRARADRRVTDV